MKRLPTEWADWPTACTPQAAKAPAVGGPVAVAGLGGAPVKKLDMGRSSGCYVAMYCTRSPRYGRVCATLTYRFMDGAQ